MSYPNTFVIYLRYIGTSGCGDLACISLNTLEPRLLYNGNLRKLRLPHKQADVEMLRMTWTPKTEIS